MNQMNSKYAPLFQPYRLNNGIEIKNRLVVAPMTHFAADSEGAITAEERLFLQGRAENFGLFITAATLVHPSGKAFHGQPEAIGPDDLPSLEAVARIIQAQGAKAILQIHHGGKLSDKQLLPDGDIIAPSADAASGARAMSEAEIVAIIAGFAKATALAIEAGFDGIEIHGANGYLLQQFFSAQSNQRQDKWGGSLVKRLTFPLSVVDAVTAVKQQAGRPDFIIGYRFSPEEPGDNGLTLVDTLALLDALVDKPLQYLHISLWDFYKRVRRGGDPHSVRIQQVHNCLNGRLPLIGVGDLFTADQILAALQTGWAEFIALGKTVMINPDLATLIVTGREKNILTELDPGQADHYRIPDFLWQQNMQGLAYLPPLKGDKKWRKLDI